MLTGKLVSVVVATFNSEKYLRDQLTSIFSQTYTNIEVIIVDDGSSDSTVDIIIEYMNDSRCYYYVNQKNLGCCKTFERGITLARGEFIALCDHDDIWDLNKIELFTKELESNDLVYSDALIINAEGAGTGQKYSSTNCLFGMDSDSSHLSYYATFNSFVLGCSMMFSAKLAKDSLPISCDVYNHDKYLFAYFSIFGRVKYIKDTTFSYRVHGGNLSKKRVKQTLLGKLQSDADPCLSSETLIKLSQYDLGMKKLKGLKDKHSVLYLFYVYRFAFKRQKYFSRVKSLYLYTFKYIISYINKG